MNKQSLLLCLIGISSVFFFFRSLFGWMDKNHPWTKALTVLKKVLSSSQTYYDICEKNAIIRIKTEAKGAYRINVYYRNGKLDWYFGSSPGDKREFYNSISNDKELDAGIDAIFRIVERKFENSSGSLPYEEFSDDKIERIAFEMISAIKDATKTLKKAYPRLLEQKNERRPFIEEVEKAQAVLNAFNDACVNEITKISQS